MTRIAPDIVDALTPVVETLERLGVPYHIGGSVASSVYGNARSTLDVDLVADLPIEQVGLFVEQLRAHYYVDDLMITDAVQRRASFNLVHLPTMIKIDVYIPKRLPFDEAAFQRVHEDTLVEDTTETSSRPFFLASPEDVILRKLQWYKAGGGVSERQWNDVLGVLKVQATALDYAYMKRWASNLGLSDLLSRAIKESGLSE